MVRRFDLLQNSVHQVAEDYLFSLDARSVVRFDMTLEMFLCLCHHMSTFGRPPSPSSDDLIYEQPLAGAKHLDP